MRQISFTAYLVLLVLCHTPTYGYGNRGHQIVAEIGYDLLTPNTQSAVKYYLAGITAAHAGTWMDEQRKSSEYAYLKPWHFINLDKGEEYHASNNPNVINAIEGTIEKLKHKEGLSDEEIRFNILVLFHLVGDIAQPLHVGYGSDKGGNDIPVVFIDRKSNLHKVWDTDIIEEQDIHKQDCMGLLAKLSDEQQDRIATVEPIAWMKDSRRLLSKVYDFDNGYIDEEYAQKNGRVIKRQLLYAGMRLAATLEFVFKDASHELHTAKASFPTDVITLRHKYYTTHFSTKLRIPWVVEYTLRSNDVNCSNSIKRTNKFAPDPLQKDITDLDDDYKGSGYDRGHNMPAADNGCHGASAMAECFYFSNMFPQTHRLNAGVWKSLEEQERRLAIQDDSIYVWIGNYGISKTIGAEEVAVPKYCWKVIYDYKTKEWTAYIFPNTLTVTGKPEDFTTTVEEIESKSGFRFQ